MATMPQVRHQCPSAMRAMLLARVKACMICGRTSNLTVDRFIPEAYGGMYTWDNVGVLCEDCNREKGGKLLSWDYRILHPEFQCWTWRLCREVLWKAYQQLSLFKQEARYAQSPLQRGHAPTAYGGAEPPMGPG